VDSKSRHVETGHTPEGHPHSPHSGKKLAWFFGEEVPADPLSSSGHKLDLSSSDKAKKEKKTKKKKTTKK